jgi:hypothetical protein
MFAVELLKLKVLFAGVFLFILLCLSHSFIAFLIVLPFIITFIIAFIHVANELPKQQLEQQMMENRIKKVLDFKQAYTYGELQHLTHTEEFLSQAKDMLFEVNAILTEMKTKEHLKTCPLRVHRGDLIGEQAALEYIIYVYNRNEE